MLRQHRSNAPNGFTSRSPNAENTAKQPPIPSADCRLRRVYSIANTALAAKNPWRPEIFGASGSSQRITEGTIRSEPNGKRPQVKYLCLACLGFWAWLPDTRRRLSPWRAVVLLYGNLIAQLQKR